MGFVDLLYRCPFCGADTVPDGEGARCSGCERAYAVGGSGGRVLVSGKDRGGTELHVGTLIDRMEDWGDEGHALKSSTVARFSGKARPVCYRNAVIGFFEEGGPRITGNIRLGQQDIRFTEDAGPAHEWRLLDLTAVQAASAAIQILPPGEGLVSFQLVGESSRRWEDVLKHRIRRLWQSAGRGEIREFQPQIRA